MQTEQSITAGAIPVLEMAEPLLGFPGRRHFALVRLDDDGVVCTLRSVDQPDLRFIVVPPAAFFAGYVPEIDDATAEALGASVAEDLLVLVMVNAADGVDRATANLRAPVIVNHRARRAAQVVLDDDSLSLRAPLVPGSRSEVRSTQKIR